MKKSSIFALVIILALSLAACGRSNDTPDSEMTILPSMDPTIDTNIPDPEVDTKMPMYTDGNGMGEDWTDPMQDGAATDGQTRNGF